MSKRILVADDDPTVTMLIRRTLAAQGYEVDSAADGAETMRMLRERQPDLMILDLIMPVMDGWQVLQALRDQGDLPQLPVLVLSGAPKDGLRSTKEFGVLFLVKPFDTPVLLAMIEYLTGVLAERLRLEGVILATRTLQHYIRNHLSLTQAYCEMLAQDASLSNRGRDYARQAVDGVRDSIDKLAILAELTGVELDEALGHDMLALPHTASAGGAQRA